jgi:uncharacterized protein
MSSATKMLLVFVDETDMWQEIPLYEAIVRRLRQLGVAGATVQTGIMGFGSHQQVHRRRLFGVTDDRPVTICVVDGEERLRSAVTDIRPMVQEGLLILMDVEVIP